MKISTKTMQKLSKTSNAIYEDIKIEFLYHSNKLEGSTFSIEQLNIILEENIVKGEHPINDVQETINSLELFDFVITTLEENLTDRLLREYHSILKKNTTDEQYGFVGIYKKIPNKLRGVDIELAQRYEVKEKIEELLKREPKNLKEIAGFHQEFEHIHPFQDGNGRIGRFIILRQCIKNNLDLIAIDNTYSKEYKKALYEAQSAHNLEPLEEIFKKCQTQLDEKMGKYAQTIKQLEEETE